MKKVCTKLYSVIRKFYFRHYADENYVFWCALYETYKNPLMLQIWGVDVITQFNDGDKIISFNIHTKRPGLVIGTCGKSIDSLQELMEKYLGVKVKILLTEIK